MTEPLTAERDAAAPGPPESLRERPPPGRRSPASVGVVPGLVLGAAVALTVLALNNGWLLPALDTGGVLALQGADALVAERPATVPVGAWDTQEPHTGLEGRGTVFPWLMSLPERAGAARTHVAGLWLVAGGLGLTVVGVGWLAGGAGGTLGAILAGLLLFLSPSALGPATSLRPETLAAAAVALQLGTMAYRPRWHAAHGGAGALAWLLHPAGVGAVAAAAAWPWALARRRPLVASVLALAPALAVVTLGPIPGMPSPPELRLLPAPSAGLDAVLAVLAWAGGAVPGSAAGFAGLFTLPALALLMRWDSVKTGPVPEDLPWHHPGTPDVLAARARPAAGLLALGLLVAAAASGGHGELARPGFLPLVPLSALAGLTLARVRRRLDARRRRLASLLVIVWIAGSAAVAAMGYGSLREEGAAHTARKWVASPVVQWLDARPWGSIRVFASDPFLVYLQTLHPVRSLPAGLPSELEAFAASFEGSPPGVIVLTEAAAERATEWESALGLERALDVSDGVVLVPPGAAAGYAN